MQRLPTHLHSKLIQFLPYLDAIRLSRCNRSRGSIWRHPVYKSEYIGRLVHTAGPVVMQNISPQLMWQVLYYRLNLSGRMVIPERKDIWSPCPEWFKSRDFTSAIISKIPGDKLHLVQVEVIKHYTEFSMAFPSIKLNAEYVYVTDTYIKYLIYSEAYTCGTNAIFADILNNILIMIPIQKRKRYVHIMEKAGVIRYNLCRHDDYRAIESLRGMLTRHTINIERIGDGCRYRFIPLVWPDGLA